ncbi:hypothetical protein LCGC14_1389600, partial [marine sediment metagenome]
MDSFDEFLKYVWLLTPAGVNITVHKRGEFLDGLDSLDADTPFEITVELNNVHPELDETFSEFNKVSSNMLIPRICEHPKELAITCVAGWIKYVRDLSFIPAIAQEAEDFGSEYRANRKKLEDEYKSNRGWVCIKIRIKRKDVT